MNAGTNAASDPDDPQLGRVVADRYLLVKRLGAGTLGVVYQARHTTLDRLATLELLDAELVDREAVREHFKSTMRTLARLRHRNVVEHESSGVDADGALYVVTKHIAAPRLNDIIERNGRLPWARVRAIALQLTAALEAAHKRSIMHGGLRPEVCYLVTAASGSEQLLVTDFALGEIAVETRFAADAKGATTRLAGDPRFLALEQFATGKGSVAADVHAAGAVLYHLLTGTPPHSGVNPFHALHQRRGRAVVAPRTIEASIPAEVEAVLLRALASAPEERYPGMRELAAALEAVPAAAVVVPIGGGVGPPRMTRPASMLAPASTTIPKSFVAPAPEAVPRLEAAPVVSPTEVMPARPPAAVIEDEATVMVVKQGPPGPHCTEGATAVLTPSPVPRGVAAERTSVLGFEELRTTPIDSRPALTEHGSPRTVRVEGGLSPTTSFARSPALPPTERLVATANTASLTTEPLPPPTAVVARPSPASHAAPTVAPAPSPTAAPFVAGRPPQAPMQPPVVSAGRMWLLLLAITALVAVVGVLVGFALARASVAERAPHPQEPSSATTTTPRSQP